MSVQKFLSIQDAYLAAMRSRGKKTPFAVVYCAECKKTFAHPSTRGAIGAALVSMSLCPHLIQHGVPRIFECYSCGEYHPGFPTMEGSLVGGPTADHSTFAMCKSCAQSYKEWQIMQDGMVME